MTDGALSWFHGSCHCGRVRFEVLATPTSLSQCNCSLSRYVLTQFDGRNWEAQASAEGWPLAAGESEPAKG